MLVRAAAVVACVVAAAAPATAQDAWVSPKERPTSVELGDRAFEPEGNLRLGPVRIHPTVRQTFTYDDNIFLSDGRETSDVVSVSTAGLRLDLLPGDWEITGGSRFRWEQYFDNNKESHFDSVSELRVNYPGRTVQMHLNERFEAIEEPLNIVTAERLERTVQTASGTFGLSLGRVGFDLNVEDQLWDFRDVFRALDHREDRIGLTARLLAAHERTLFVQYELGVIDYARDFRNDYLTHEVLAGVRGKVSAKLDGEIAAGWAVSDVHEATGAPSAPDFSGPVGRAQISWKPSVRWALTLRYRTGVQFSQVGDYQVVDRGEVSAEWRPAFSVVLRLFGAVENNDPPGSPPFLNNELGCTADWDVRSWISVGVGTGYRWRQTHIPNAEYRNFRVWVHLSMYL